MSAATQRVCDNIIAAINKHLIRLPFFVWVDDLDNLLIVPPNNIIGTFLSNTAAVPIEC